MKFADIPGHEDIKEQLRRMVDSGQMPHALLLEGPAGSGKFALARALAQYIHCGHRTADGDSCGTCPACRQHQTFNHIDTIYSFPVVKRSGVGRSDDYIAEFCEFMADSPFMDFENWLLKLDNINAQPAIYVEESVELIRKLSYTAHASEYKIVLMWLPERLREDAANKLLKLIEEPHPDTLFIITSDNSRAILPTIYSRLRRIAVTRYSDGEVGRWLQDNYPVEAADAAALARMAGGNLVEAARMVSVSKDREKYLAMFMELMRLAYTRKVADLKKWAAALADLGREREMRFYEYCARMMRENFIYRLNDPRLSYLNAAERQFSANFSPYINEHNVLKFFEVINDAYADIAANANGKLVNFDVAVKSILLLKK